MCLAETATVEDGELIAKLFGSVGKIWRADEKHFDAITALRYDAIDFCSSKSSIISLYLFSYMSLLRQLEF